MRKHTSTVIVAVMGLAGAFSGMGQAPPSAEKRPKEISVKDDTLIDEYAWLRDREDPATIDYLKAENGYAEAVMKHSEDLQENLYREMVGRLKQTDLSVPYRHGPFYYYSRTIKGLNYPIHCRKFGSRDAAEQVILDVNALAGGREFLRVASRAISPDHRYLAYTIDATGYEDVSISIKDLATGFTSPDVITKAAPWGLTWAADGKTLFYLRTDEAKRTNRVFRHVLGSGEKEDALVYQEDDERFSVGVYRTRSDGFVVIASTSKSTSEIRVIDSRRPAEDPRVIAPRRPKVLYHLDHRRGPDAGWFYILTDAEDSPNFKLLRAPAANPAPENWETVIPHSREHYLTGVDVFADFLVLSERRGGLSALRVRRFSVGEEHSIEMPEPVASIRLDRRNVEYETTTLRISYTYIKSYSPYENVAAQDYPDLLVTAGLNDPRVHYWEPAKWVARLRDRKTGDGVIVLKTNLGAGHGGATGRYDRIRETAFEYAFLIDRLSAPAKPLPSP